MGSSTTGFNGEYRNCIKGKRKSRYIEEFTQYDSYGNNIYKIIKDKESRRIEKFIVYDIDQREIGSIEKQANCDRINFTLYDQNNQITKHIEKINDCCTCCSTNYNFYGVDNDIEAIAVFKAECNSTEYEVYDKYNTMINRAEMNIKCCEENYFHEYDQNFNKVFKIIWKRASLEKTFKIFDNNETEVNLENKTLFNDGFTKIQVILILEMLFFNNDDD